MGRILFAQEMKTSLLFDLEGEGSQGFDVIYSDGVESDTLENISDGHIETITPTQSRNYFCIGCDTGEYLMVAASVSGNAFVNVNFAPTQAYQVMPLFVKMEAQTCSLI